MREEREEGEPAAGLRGEGTGLVAHQDLGESEARGFVRSHSSEPPEAASTRFLCARFNCLWDVTCVRSTLRKDS